MITITLMLIILLTFNIQALEKDKLYHFGVGSFIYFMSEQLNFKEPIIMVTGAGLTKEIHDYMNRDYHTPEVEDLIFTVLGGLFLKVVF